MKRHGLTIEKLKKGYRSGAFTVQEILAQVRETMEETKQYNIWIHVLTEEEQKPYVDALMKMDPAVTPLWGVPFAIKDNIDLADVPSTAACKEFEYVPEKSAFIVERLIKAGAIPVGKTNMDQFATGLVGTRSPYGETHNAYREELISGGSSSGSAVSVALGMAAFSLGTDTAGSGRVPAMLNNLVGLKPSVGSWSARGVVPACESIDCPSVFANTIEDAALVNEILHAEDKEYRYSKAFAPIEKKQPKTVYVPMEEPTFYGDFAEQYREGFHKAISHMEKLGYTVKPYDTKRLSEAALLLYGGPYVTERYAGLKDFILEHEDAFFPVTRTIICGGTQDDWKAADLFNAMHTMAEIKKETHNALKDSVLILPTSGGTFTREQVDADPIATNSKMGLYTNHCNLLDLCAIAIPSDFLEENLPFGFTAFAISGEDGMLETFAETYINSKKQETMTIAVCGLHMRGFALEHQLTDLDATYLKTVKSAACYRMYELDTTPAKPGMIMDKTNGKALEMELWSIPVSKVGAFLAQIPAPLGLGKIRLEDGTSTTGFICEPYAVAGAKDITDCGGWRYR